MGGAITAIYTGKSYAVDIINTTYLIGDIKMYVDGIEKPVSKTYKFGDTKDHEIVFEFSKRQTSINSIFNNSDNLKNLDLSNFDTSKVNSMISAFASCYNLQSLDLSSIDTSMVTDMTAMFNFSISLTSVDLSGLNTSRVTSMYGMFSTCHALSVLDLSSFDTSNVTNMSGMFEYCNSLRQLTMMGNIDKLETMDKMFTRVALNGVFEYNKSYDYSKIIEQLPSTWRVKPI